MARDLSAGICLDMQGQPGIIGLHGGLPAGSAFPITSLSFTLRDGTTATIDDPAKVCIAHLPVGCHCCNR